MAWNGEERRKQRLATVRPIRDGYMTEEALSELCAQIGDIKETLKNHLLEEAETQRKVNRIDLALFATDDKNEFGRTGVIHTFTRIDNFLDVSCKFAKFVRGAALFLIPTVSAVFAVGKYWGWW